MGNHAELPQSNWNFVRRDDKYDIYQNEFGILAQKHVVPNDPRLKQEEEMATYFYRYNTSKPIVKVYKADYQAGSDFCSNHKNVVIYSEYIPFRLIDTRHLTHDQGIYVLSQALIGFHELYSHLGSFPVDDTLIGFNKDGRVRVWHSPDFASNHFINNNVVLMSTTNPHGFDERIHVKQQEEMVDDIWKAVNQHATFNVDFRNQVNSLPNLNFYNIKEVVDEEVRRLKHVPARLRFEDKYGIIQSSKMISSKASIYSMKEGYGSQRNLPPYNQQYDQQNIQQPSQPNNRINNINFNQTPNQLNNQSYNQINNQSFSQQSNPQYSQWT